MSDSSYFLPFTPVGKKTELAAIELKERLGLGPYDSVDPYEALEVAGARLISAEEYDRLPSALRETMFRSNGDLSAVGLGRSPYCGRELIILNQAHHPHRRRVSLMEELVHIVLGHPRVVLAMKEDGLWKRTFDADVEDEAFRVGAACIIPYRWLFNEIKYGQAPLQVASAKYEVSPGYVQYRIKRAGLTRAFNAKVTA